MKNHLVILLYLLVTACSRPESNEKDSTLVKPNIVFIYTDDQTYETISALGYNEIHTPNMDRLVDSGTTFTHAYNMGGWNGAICVASRAMINSGAFIWNAQQKSGIWKQKDSVATSQSWGRLMAKQGYNTYMTGKWHVPVPAGELFDQAEHVRPGMPHDKGGQLRGSIQKWKEESGDMKDWNEYMPVGYGRPLSEDDDSWLPTDTTQGGFWKGGKHWSEVVKDDALGFIADATKKEDPFFMYLAFNAPHDPRQSPQKFIDMYPLDNIAVPESFLPEYPYKDDMGNSPSLRDEALAPYPRTEYAVKKHRQEYYAIITHLDEQIGKILDALEASGKMDNTYIFFTADHGLSVGQHGLIGKQSLFDHSIRVPLMVAGPDIPKGKRLDQDVYLQDIMATSLELAGIEKPNYVEFNSFKDIIDGQYQKSHYDAIYGAYVNFQRMIRKDGFKLIVYPKINKVLLFDLKNDPEEMNDLAENEEYADKVKSLFKDLIDLQKTMGDELNLNEIYQQL
ncbi:sulfatase-like hydrolase/transferase [Reichenbachiella sp. MALMAid0571]|uniref:sulfatase-like hydrolase/transferase n=1 Tax=Reichenbachiella sp. MALMAid0571 TaxID=3143939 RepID=UPI0032DF000D